MTGVPLACRHKFSVDVGVSMLISSLSSFDARSPAFLRTSVEFEDALSWSQEAESRFTSVMLPACALAATHLPHAIKSQHCAWQAILSSYHWHSLCDIYLECKPSYGACICRHTQQYHRQNDMLLH